MKIKLKYYPQHKDYSCGPSALRMVFEHLGKHYSEEKMIQLCKAMPKIGTSHNHLIEEVKKEGFYCLEKDHGKIKDIIESLEQGYLPLINYYNPLSNSGHYSVICGYDSNEELLFLADPANGNDYTLSYGEFKKLWHNFLNNSKGWFLLVGRSKFF
ncbi:hypothetical protein CMO93_04085 [Candidatus Woesearchaeota archaeon]|nr:hypothetical protein [Candidatus Woesearchaeota archaeon]|tara:strand:+ start:3216 stop:3683 length:468 start_codon:yes stop_codon:yes gene_type:complete